MSVREKEEERKPSFGSYRDGGCFRQELLMDSKAVE